MSRFLRVGFVLVLAGSLWGCSSKSNVAGTWSGQDVQSDGTTLTTNLTLSQNGSTVTGTLNTLNGTTQLYSGTVFGTLSGSSFTFTITVNVGQVLGEPSCSFGFSGSAVFTPGSGATPATLSGEYVGTGGATCAEQVIDDTFTWNQLS